MGEQRTRDAQQQPQSPLKTERGSTTIQDGVVSKIAAIAAQEVDGVQLGGGGASEAVGGVLSAVPGVGGGGSQSRGISVEVGERSEEHTSELQSRQYLVCRLLLEKKKK